MKCQICKTEFHTCTECYDDNISNKYSICQECWEKYGSFIYKEYQTQVEFLEDKRDEEIRKNIELAKKRRRK